MSGVYRNQQTLERPVEVSGFGFFTGADSRLRVLPAAAGSGIVFRRVDLTDAPEVAARIENVIPSPRRTTIVSGEARVEMVEHVMAALAGLQIDNAVVEINAPEPPGFDGSCRDLCHRLVEAGICQLDQPAVPLVIDHTHSLIDQTAGQITVRPHIRRLPALTYQLDYGHRSPIPAQLLSVELTPEIFLQEIAWARTFVLEAEVNALRAQGFGTRVTARDVLVFGPRGVIDNALRRPDECVRHKILDCVGDFALLGSSIHGHFCAWRSGHGMNHGIIRYLNELSPSLRSAA